MAPQIIDTTTNHGTWIGDLFPVAFGKCNDNFAESAQGVAEAKAAAVAAQNTANAALPISGGTATGPIFRAGVQNQEMFRIQNTGTQVGIGGSFGSWSSNRTPGLQVDCQSRADAYMVARATNWGVAHLFALDVYQGTQSDVITANFHFPGKENAMRFFANGNVTFAGTLTQNSDYRIKDEIDTIDPQAAAASLRATRPVEYTDISDAARPRRSGYVADEHQVHFGLLVDGVKDAVREEMVMVGDTTPYAPGEEPVGYVPPRQELKDVPVLQSVNYVGMVPYLHAGWMEHDNRVAALEKDRNEMLATIAGLSARLKALEPST